MHVGAQGSGGKAPCRFIFRKRRHEGKSPICIYWIPPLPAAFSPEKQHGVRPAGKTTAPFALIEAKIPPNPPTSSPPDNILSPKTTQSTFTNTDKIRQSLLTSTSPDLSSRDNGRRLRHLKGRKTGGGQGRAGGWVHTHTHTG